MVSRGRQERALVEYLVEHYQQHPQDLDVLQRLHPRALVEVLQMRNLTPEQIGLDYPALLDLIGKERALDLIGKERTLNLIGDEQALDFFGKEKVRQWLQRQDQADAQGPAAAPAPSPPPPPEKANGVDPG